MVHPLKNNGSCHTATTTIATREKRREEEDGQQGKAN
jgi:hypothetical protein